MLASALSCKQDNAPPATTAASLAQIGKEVTLNVWASGTSIKAELVPGGESPCPIVDAQATANGKAMTVDSAGGGTVEPYGDNTVGCSGGLYTHVCQHPTFEGPSDPASAADVEVRITDSTSSYVFHATVISYAAMFEPPYDGVLHPGTWVNIAVTPALQPQTDFLVNFYADTDASPNPVFSLPWLGSSSCTATGDGGGCLVRLTPTGVSFLVPSATPQPGTLVIDRVPTSQVLECTGPAHCALNPSTSGVPNLQTTLGP